MGAQGGDQRGIRCGRRGVRDFAAAAGGQAGDVDEVLHRDGDAVQQALRLAFGPARGALARCLQRAGVHQREGVDLRVFAGGALGDGLQDLQGRQGFIRIGGEELFGAEGGYGPLPVRVHSHGGTGRFLLRRNSGLKSLL